MEVDNIRKDSALNLQSLKNEMNSKLEASESELKDANQLIADQKQEIKSLEAYINELRPYLNQSPSDMPQPATENQK